MTDDERRRDCGAFWDTIHGTLAHILWGDRTWMSRFSGWAKPDAGMKDSPRLIDDYTAQSVARIEADRGIESWAAGVTDAWLADDLVWSSGATGRELRGPREFLVAHFFNHQTHHRGQAHALITNASQKTGGTDLFVLLDGPR